ncbi:MAG TPA: aminopeptidase [Cyclobacteriaceae bacterium]|nr:aminopeptidase [Cyclobacteriaceae bacterium]
MKAVSIVVLACLILGGCGSKSKESSSKLLAERIIQQCSIHPGERVLMMVQPGKFDSLVFHLNTLINQAGAVNLGVLNVDSTASPAGWETDFTKSILGKSKEELVALFDDVDLGLMLPGATPDQVPYAAMQEVLKKGKGRTVHFHWSGLYNFEGLAIEVDSLSAAIYEKAVLNTDYAKLSKIQDEFEAALRSKGGRIITPEGTDITFKIGDRNVTKQNGDASLAHARNGKVLIDREVELPAGAIRVAPIEESVEGTVFIQDSQWRGQTVRGLRMKFSQGKAVDIEVQDGMKNVFEELRSAGDNALMFREIAVGFNPWLQVPLDRAIIPYYGYGAGVVRVSLGDNSELGGKVTGGYVRWNMLVNATLIIGDEVWIENGRLKK